MDGLKTTQAERSILRKAYGGRHDDTIIVLDDLDTAFARVAELEALLGQADKIIEQAMSCVAGETPEDMTPDEACRDTYDKLRRFLNRPRTAARVHAALSEELKS